MIEFGRAVCNDFDDATRREWLVANGLGGYGMGTIAGALCRRYHGLLVAATAPPGRRVMLLSALEPELVLPDRVVPLWTQEWGDGSVSPRGDQHLERFVLEGSIPAWTWSVGPWRLQRRLWMPHGLNSVAVRFTLAAGSRAMVRLNALTTHRSHHATVSSARPPATVEPVADGVKVTAHAGATALWIQSRDARVLPGLGEAWANVLLRVERQRGYDAIDTLHHTATIEAELGPGDSFTVVAGVEPAAILDGAALLDAARRRDEANLAAAGAPADELHRRLVLAADQFVVRRRYRAIGAAVPVDGESIVAGYPWFEDWGRDTFVALPGLCLATGRVREAAAIVRTFAASLDQGMLPNRFPDEGGSAEYHTVDATLWFVESAFRTAARLERQGRGADDALLHELLPTFGQILRCHLDGTRHGIRMDPADALLRAGEPGLQLTWMDAKIGDRVITPRIGKPVEIAALWYSALRRLAGLAATAGAPIGGLAAAEIAALALRARGGFTRFANPVTGCLFDVIDGPEGDDGSVRPNQLVAAALPESPLDDATARRVVDRCAATLLASLGLRTLDPADPRYRGRYVGTQERRDEAYHQGTAWPWLIAPFALAHLRVHRDPAALRALIEPLRLHLSDAGLGSVSEVADGDAPHDPGGCPAQAWSVGALLEVLEALGDAEASPRARE